jgi:hypothetical protein
MLTILAAVLGLIGIVLAWRIGFVRGYNRGINVKVNALESQGIPIISVDGKARRENAEWN